MIFPTYALLITQVDNQARWNVDIRYEVFSFKLPAPDGYDVDHSYAIKVCDLNEYSAIEKAITIRFWGYDTWRRDAPRAWSRLYEKKEASGRTIHHFIGQDEAGHSVARQMLDFVFENRVALGDNGDWHCWTFRDLLLKRPGVNFTDLAHEEIKKTVVVKPVPGADYTDELDSFRFPSVSCLYGASQPLSELRGVVKFRKLFIQDGAGVYIVFDGDAVLYVGMSQQFSQRLCNAMSHHKLRLIIERHPDACVAVIHYPDWKLTVLDEAMSEGEVNAALTRVRELLFAFERACIEHYQPCYNGRSAAEAQSE